MCVLLSLQAAALVMCRRHRTCPCGRVCSLAVLQVDLKADVKICVGGAVSLAV